MFAIFVFIVLALLTALGWQYINKDRLSPYISVLGLEKAALVYSQDFKKLIDTVLPTRRIIFSITEPIIWLYTDKPTSKTLFLTSNYRGDVRIWFQLNTFLDGVHIVLDGSGNDRASFSNLVSYKLPEEKLDLEGDFPQHFKLYCGHNQQIIALQIIAPNIMAYCIDNMIFMDVEIIDNQVAMIVRGGARNKEVLIQTLELALKLDRIVTATSKVKHT